MRIEEIIAKEIVAKETAVKKNALGIAEIDVIRNAVVTIMGASI